MVVPSGVNHPEDHSQRPLSNTPKHIPTKPDPTLKEGVLGLDARGETPSPPIRSLLVAGVKYDYEAVTFQGRSGKPITRQIVRHPGSVIVLPVWEAEGRGLGKRVVLIRNWRPSVEAWLWELPAGTRGRGEDPLGCAMRELTEETGMRLGARGRMEALTTFYTSPGLSDEFMHAFVATGLEPVGQDLEEDEFVTVHPVEVGDVWEMVQRGEIRDLKTLHVLSLARERGLL